MSSASISWSNTWHKSCKQQINIWSTQLRRDKTIQLHVQILAKHHRKPWQATRALSATNGHGRSESARFSVSESCRAWRCPWDPAALGNQRKRWHGWWWVTTTAWSDGWGSDWDQSAERLSASWIWTKTVRTQIGKQAKATNIEKKGIWEMYILHALLEAAGFFCFEMQMSNYFSAAKWSKANPRRDLPMWESTCRGKECAQECPQHRPTPESCRCGSCLDSRAFHRGAGGSTWR